jgi:hypothetical protein
VSFLLYVAAGFFGGLLGGMGMGGGTIAIPVLTILLGVEQHVAQATNLIAFLPMAAFSLNVHKKQGLLVKEGTLSIIIPAVITSVLFGFVAAFLPAYALKKLFGAFLIALAIQRFGKIIHGF